MGRLIKLMRKRNWMCSHAYKMQVFMTKEKGEKKTNPAADQAV